MAGNVRVVLREESSVRDRSPQTVWETALGQLELQVTRPNFETWLRNTTGLSLEGDDLVVGVPTDFAIEWLRSRLWSTINQTVSQLLGTSTAVSFQVLGAPLLAANGGTHPAGAKPAGPPPDLDRRLTFDSFTTLKSNRMAARAARRFVDDADAGSPLVLFGATGLGKSHLLHAVGHAAAGSSKRVALLTGEAFVTRYGESVRAGKPHVFRQLFEGLDVFLLDDLGFLCTRTASQEQFFHIFDALHARGASIAVTADAAPDDLAGLSPRLLSRLHAGLAVELKPVAPDERYTFLSTRAGRLSTDIPEPILRNIADLPCTNIRQLAGALQRVVAYAELSGKPLSTDDVPRALQPFATSREAAPAAIIDAVCAHFGLKKQQLCGPSRAREITYARHIAMHLLRQTGGYSLSEIGALLGGRDHTTVLNANRRIERELASSLPSDTKAILETISARLAGQEYVA